MASADAPQFLHRSREAMTRRAVRHAWGLVMVAACAIVIGAQEPPTGSHSQAFQEAVTLMEARGDCRAASPIFARVAEGNDRSLAARALVYLGTCHERLGRAEAAATYRRVIERFPEQRTAVAEARRRLTALAPVATTRPARTPTLRQAWEQRPPFIASGGGASADGRVLAFIDTDGGVSLTDLESAKTRRQMVSGGEGSVGLKPVPSPDGTAVIYSWTPAGGGAAELRLTRAANGPARVLHRAASGETLLVHDWPRDDRLLLEITRVDGSVSLQVLDVGEKSLTPIVDLRHHPGSAAMSPDGHWIAYDTPTADGRTRDIVIVPGGGGVPRVLVDGASDDYVPAWSPRGDQLLFVSDRSGSASLWAHAISDGQLAGPYPMLLQRDIGIVVSLVGVTPSGAYHYLRQIGLVDVFVQPLDGGGRPTGSARATSRTVGGSLMPSFATDGRTLVHVSGMATSGGALDEFDITSGVSQTKRSGLDYIRQPRWSPDGRHLLAKGMKSGDRFGIYRIDLEAGKADPLVTVPSDEETELGAFTWLATPAGTIGYVRGAATVRRLTVARAEDTHWFDADGVTRIVAIAAAPDDDRIAFIGLRGQAHALIVRETDGVMRDLVTVAAGESGQIQSLAWAPDGRSVLFTRRNGADRIASLWRVAAAGGAPEALGVQAEGMRDLAMSPDGRHIAWTAGFPRRESWVLEHVIRPLPPAR